ncbi:MAG: indole-3-glycerol phosphate synthase TrpC [Nonlabens sp.]
MVDILKKITDRTLVDLTKRKKETTLSVLREMPHYSRHALSLVTALKNGSGIIAEHKRQSPSKGSFENLNSLASIVKGYENAGASAISCLTDMPFFGGSLADLVEVQRTVDIPVLRKDFMIDSYQIHEAKAYGADAILLIAACLDDQQLATFSSKAVELGLSVLFEVHERKELDRVNIIATSLPAATYAIGVNNRNLKEFKTDIQTSHELYHHIPADVVAVSESGIDDPAVANELITTGFKGFLIGEYFMRQQSPGSACATFIKELES